MRAAGAGRGKRIDPLATLRECTLAKQKVRMHEDILDFNGNRVHRSSKCGFRLSASEPCIDIGSVWYMLKQVCHDKPYTKEVARKRGFEYIGIGVRGDLCDYLEGKIETCRGIVTEVLEGRKRPVEDRTGDPLARRRQRTSAGGAPGAVRAVAPEAVGTATTAAAPRPFPAKGFKVADLCYADVEARVRAVKDLDVLVRTPGRPIPNADTILKIAQDEVSKWHSRRRLDAPREQSMKTKQPLVRELEGYLASDPKANPIILVPCSKTAPLNLLNVGKFLQDGIFERADAEHTKFFESTRKEYVEVARNIGGRMWTFEIRDSAKNFTKAQWLRVVACVTDGSEWGFAGWPFKTVVDLFTTVKGVFLNEVGVLTPLHVRMWAVTLMDMHLLQFQHRYAELRDNMWVQIESWMNAYRFKKFSNDSQLDKVDVSLDRPLPVL